MGDQSLALRAWMVAYWALSCAWRSRRFFSSAVRDGSGGVGKEVVSGSAGDWFCKLGVVVVWFCVVILLVFFV